MALVIPAVTPWFEGLWSFYRSYTNTAIHTAATAALAIFGILVFVDPLFAVLAIASYLGPPVVLYVLADDPVLEDDFESSDTDRIGESVAPPSPRERSGLDGETAAGDGDGDTEFVRDGRDDGSDGYDRDTDSDRGNGDTDSDSDDGDTDSDSDDGDTDSDSDG